MQSARYAAEGLKRLAEEPVSEETFHPYPRARGVGSGPCCCASGIGLLEKLLEFHIKAS